MNVRDAQIILGMLQERGYAQAKSAQEAQVILYNTCSVRQHAEDKVWSEIGRLAKTPRPTKKIVGLVGCMAQNYQEEIFRRFPYVDLVCGPANIYEIPDLVQQAADGKTHLLATDKDRRLLRKEPLCRPASLKAFVNIMYGCNNFCSYCVVPYVRRREQSRPLKHILAEVKELAEQGCKEITLLGQNVNSYGRDLTDGIDFVGLLEKIDRIKGIERIRFVTSHPRDAAKRLFQAMRDLPRVCEHLHLPIQSGSDKILALMRRGYTLQDYSRLVEQLRRLMPNCSLTTDIIVGFPGETEADFQKTRQVLNNLQFDEAFIFKYSSRPRTRAAGLKDDVPLPEKERRNRLLLALQEQISLAKNKRLLGTVQEILTEGRGRVFTDGCAKNILQGRTRTNKVSLFPGKTSLVAQVVKVNIKRATTHTLIGEIDGKKS